MNTSAILDYLRGQQEAGGGFVGRAAPQIEPFVPRRQQATIFHTALILDCLHHIVGAEDIRLRAAKYLEAQVSQQGSWNYWEKAAPARQRQPYPDDLDDTACVLAALSRADPKWVNGTRLGSFARLLVAAEQQPGGPYNTWLIDTAKAPQWRQVDPAVNANIGYALALHKVRLAGLTAYFDALLRQGTLQSDYYVSEISLLYFLSRWYRGAQLPALCAKVQAIVDGQTAGNALHQALILTTACRLGMPRRQLAGLAHQLQAAAKGRYWPAAALYVDPVHNGRQYYGGSKALTTALALEALTSYIEAVDKPAPVIARKRGVPHIMMHVRHDADGIPAAALRRRYLAAARSIMQDVAGQQITAPASLVAGSAGWQLPPAQLRALNLGSLNGWIAYSLYDDFLDGSARPAQLNVANIALRRSYAHFGQALPEHMAFVAQVFDTMDSANDWEQHYARAVVEDGIITLRHLPDYTDYAQLANRSLGHSLAVWGATVLQYGSADSPQAAAIQSFFKHFLIARQLNDDAHDWEDDLRAGHLTAVVTRLLGACYELPCKFTVQAELDKLRQHFWRNTVLEVAQAIRDQLEAAQQALHTLANDSHIAVLLSWLDALEASVSTALRSRDEALQFMKAYEGSHARAHKHI